MMKIRLLVLAILITASGVFAQKDILRILNANFELGTVQLWRAVEVRDGAVWWIGVDDALSTVEISDDANTGNYAAAFTWEIDPAMVDIVFDLSPMVEEGINYTFKAWAKSLDGPCILHLHCTYYTKNNVVVGDHADGSWTLSDVYEEHVWDVPPAPENVLFAQIGFRAIDASGARWPETAVTTLIDDMTMWRDSRESDGIDYELATNFTGPGTGTIEFVPAGGIYCEGTEVLATFIPDEDSQFAGWSGDATGTEKTVTVIMNGDKTIVAETDIVEGIEDIIYESSDLLCYPNPFNSSTTLSYTLNENSSVNLSIYNITGSLVNILVSENQNRGDYSVSWNGTGFSEGIYFAKLVSGNGKSQSIKILLNK